MFVNVVFRHNFTNFSCNAFNNFIFWIFFLLGFVSFVYYQECRFDTDKSMRYRGKIRCRYAFTLLIRRFVCIVTVIIFEESSGQKVQDSISFFFLLISAI